MQAKFRAMGWQASFEPCTGKGNTASGGVSLLARTGHSFTPLTAHNCFAHVPRSQRLGAWLVHGGFKGGHVVVVLYLVTGIGLAGQNLEILDELAIFLNAVGKPFVVLADWNFNPGDLKESGWLAAVGGTVVSSGRPTCTQNGSASELDFAVFSRHWTGMPTVELYEDFVPSPHTAVALAFPGVLPVVSVEVLQRPRVFPAAHPYGPEPQPVPERDVVDLDLGCDLDTPVLPRDVIDAAASTWYTAAENELALRYGISLADEPRHGGRSMLPVPVTRQFFVPSRGTVAASPQVAFCRRLSARITEFASLRRLQHPTFVQRRTLFALRRSLPRALPPGIERPPVWFKWKAIVAVDILVVQIAMLYDIVTGFLGVARDLEAKAALARTKAWLDWARRSVSAGDASVFPMVTRSAAIRCCSGGC